MNNLTGVLANALIGSEFAKAPKIKQEFFRGVIMKTIERMITALLTIGTAISFSPAISTTAYAQSQRGGNTGGGPKVNGVPLITYLRQKQFSHEKVLGYISGTLNRIKKVDAELAEALEAGVRAIDWYMVDVKLDKLPYAITQLPFDSKKIDQMMVQNDGRVYVYDQSFNALLAKAKSSGDLGLIPDAIIPELFEYNFLQALNVNTNLTPKSYQDAALLVTKNPLPSKEELRKKLATIGFTVDAKRIQAKQKRSLESLNASAAEEMVPVAIPLSAPIRLEDARKAQDKCLNSKDKKSVLYSIGEQFMSFLEATNYGLDMASKWEANHNLNVEYSYYHDCISTLSDPSPDTRICPINESTISQHVKYLKVNSEYNDDVKEKYLLRPSTMLQSIHVTFGTETAPARGGANIETSSTTQFTPDGEVASNKLYITRGINPLSSWSIESSTDFIWITHNPVETDPVYDKFGDLNLKLRLKNLAFMVPKSVNGSGQFTFKNRKGITVPVIIDAKEYMSCVTNEMQNIVKGYSSHKSSTEAPKQNYPYMDGLIAP